MKNKYLFILCPPACGSTLLWQILKTSPRVSAFKSEGQALVRALLFTSDRWNPNKPIPWHKVKEKWHEHWDLDQPVLVEKSPPHLVRAHQLEKQFPESYFIIMIRNPYAFCEGVKRRWLNKVSYFNLAKFWVTCAKYQIDNNRHLQHCITFTYEDLTDNPEQVCQRIIDFVPDLEKLHPKREFDVFEREMSITNLNDRQIARLSDNDIFAINEVCKRYPSFFSYFNYRYLEPAESLGFKALRRAAIKWRSLRRAGPVRWQNWKKLD